ncbi:alpha/beta hydrolase [Streptomyces sp. NPDC057499]|uniref:alpha/beta hydrolase n=1 Tax=Streptomyces sp. NPDC057499 TaxID=3346150 RepID=UPI0036C712FE
MSEERAMGTESGATAFVLVPDAHTGGWVWARVADRLRAAGARALPVTLTGMRDEPGAAVPEGGTPEAHVDDVVRLIDGLPESTGVVLVGHGYGIHPALGAAARRTGRVRRIVYVDTAPAQDGAPALALLPDPEARALLTAPGAPGHIAPPDRAGWQRWGHLADVPAEALDRLAELAAPQPAGTLTAPLRLPAEVAALPSTGVLCTANGSSLAVLGSLVGLGDPGLVALTEPRVRFFELAAGHWPMLSAPDELAGVLLRAADGGGERLAAPTGPPPHLRPFLLDVPERPRERTGRVDLYPPDADGPRPAVLLVHGGPVPAEARPTPRDWPSYTGYARLLAERGVLAATVDHRMHDVTDCPRAAADVAAAVDLLRADPRVDPDRVALWFFSGGGLLCADWLAASPPWLRCVAATYPVLAPQPAWGLGGGRFDTVGAVRSAGAPPVVLTRVGLELPQIAETVAAFLAAAEESGAKVEVIDVPGGHHGFETLDHTEEARGAVHRALGSVLGHLGA